MENSTNSSPESHLPHILRYGPKPAIVLSNDDGISPQNALILDLAQALVATGQNVFVCAPGKNKSACGQSISLSSPLTLRRHLQFEQQYTAPGNGTLNSTHGSLFVFSIDEGTPSDCIHTAIEPYGGLLAKLGFWPQLAVSGINFGQNVGGDIIYSGTFAAARQAAMYGIPSIASSLDLFVMDHENDSHVESCTRAIDATIQIVRTALRALPAQPIDVGRLHPKKGLQGDALCRDPDQENGTRIMDAFSRGDVIINMNLPLDWGGNFQCTSLDGVLYRNVIQFDSIPQGESGDKDETVTLKIGGQPGEYMSLPNSDSVALQEKRVASISTLQTWPSLHPLALPVDVFDNSNSIGLPNWLVSSSHCLQRNTATLHS